MLPVPESLAALLSAFAIAFTRPTFAHVQVLVSGTLLTSGRRTVAAALRAVGLGGERHFTTYHRVLNRTVWSPLRLSRILLHQQGSRSRATLSRSWWKRRSPPCRLVRKRWG